MDYVKEKSAFDLVKQGVALALTLGELAKVAGLPRSTVESWIRRGGGMTHRSAVLLMAALVKLRRRQTRLNRLTGVLP
jgi:hypothetical protein